MFKLGVVYILISVRVPYAENLFSYIFGYRYVLVYRGESRFLNNGLFQGGGDYPNFFEYRILIMVKETKTAEPERPCRLSLYEKRLMKRNRLFSPPSYTNQTK